jgi:hypothetical protein
MLKACTARVAVDSLRRLNLSLYPTHGGVATPVTSVPAAASAASTIIRRESNPNDAFFAIVAALQINLH